MRRHGLLTIKNHIVLYTLLYLIIVCAGYAILVKNHLSMIWNTDALFQYYPTILYAGNLLRECIKGILSGNPAVHFYDLSIALGESIIGALNYYGLNDPMNLLTVFVTDTQSAAIFYALSYFIRIWLAGLCFQRYCHIMGLDDKVSVIAALMYCFSGFTMKGCGRYIEWLPVLMYFPLMLIGSEHTIRNKRISMTLLVATAYGSLTGFYFLYMASLATGIYWIIRLLTIHGRKGITQSVHAICRLFAAYLLGLMLTAPIFLTAVSGYLRSERSGESILDVVLDINNYIPTINEEIVQWAPFVKLSYASYVLIVEFITAFLVFFFRSRRGRQLQIALVMAAAACVMPITGWIFNGFGETNIRWIFLVHFLMALVFAFVLSEVQSVEIRTADGTAHLNWGQYGIRCLAAAIVVVNIVVNIYALYSDHGIGWKNEYVAMEDLDLYTDSPVNDSQVIADDDDLFRIAHTSFTTINGRPENVAMLNDYYGICWWFSIINENGQRLVDLLNGQEELWRSYGVGNVPIYEAFMGAKYYLSLTQTQPATEPEYEVETLTFNDEQWSVYQNPYYFGMAYTRDRGKSTALWEERDSMESYYMALYDRYIDSRMPVETTYVENADIFLFSVNDSEDDELVVLVLYDPNWHAYVDGVEVEITRADVAFMSVPINTDSSEVVFRYVPSEFYIGFAFVGLAIVILLIHRIVITRGSKISTV